jgi:hypothetical protein
LAINPDQRFDVRLRFLENHLTNFPPVFVQSMVGGEEMIREDPAGGYVPVVAWSTLEVKLEVICGATRPCFRIPGLELIRMDDILKPIVLGD